MTLTGEPGPRSIAVIGSGVAGLTAAHVLSSTARVTLYESDDRLGGHAHTHAVTMPSGATVPVDSGFIVHNDRTYPTLLRLFDELRVATQPTDMSMSVSSRITGLEYAGALGVSGLFPTARNLTRPRYVLMLAEVKRFHRAARTLLDEPDDSGRDIALAEFAEQQGFSTYFRDNFLNPLVAAVWSCDESAAARYPARYLFTFLDHHGMLSVFGSPQWRTVVGGSISYVSAVADEIGSRGGDVRTNAPVTRVTESDGGVEVTADDGAGPSRFDAVVIATHPHQALGMLADATPLRRKVLGDITYLSKPAALHTDTSLMPRARRAWASWNYQIRSDGDEVAVTYDLTRLMRLPTTDPRMLVTLGRTDLIDPTQIRAQMTYEHPLYTTESVAAQALLPQIDSDTIVFAGAYHGWGFHEDGAASGARAAARLGVTWGPHTDRRVMA
ncbi:FAD-dependent oxidoreductase [Gordonia sp. NPDC003585]|uniref:NAD(P)/FAD-dependent oxidoreductase n=1 Tax=unclassified Gordonia (in: high G+C Gram-positive bacteria) TaxID=2657482 RepID=UPI0033B1F036